MLVKLMFKSICHRRGKINLGNISKWLESNHISLKVKARHTLYKRIHINSTMSIVSLILIAGCLKPMMSLASEEKPKHLGELNCPQSKTAHFHWLPYESQLKFDNKTKKVYGKLKGYIAKALSICCSSLQLNYSQMEVDASKEIELFIRKDRSAGLSLYFPVFANKYQKEKFQRPFIGLYDSPGPVIFVYDKEPTKGAVLTALTQSWQIPALCVLLASISGVLLWFW